MGNLRLTKPPMSGPEVRKLQKRLHDLGFAPGVVDGIFGSGTDAAVRAFQQANGLELDGIAGAATMKALSNGQAASPAPAPSPHPAGTSEKGLEFIGRFEGFRGQLYNDAAVPANATIGFGHLVHRGPINGSEPAEFRAGLTNAQALELLKHDAAAAEAAVRASVKVPLTQPQFDALVSFVFNCGGGALAQSQLLRDLNAGNYAAVPADLMHFTHAGSQVLQGLVNRRQAEGALFAQGTY
jgi:lysozyme